jgi:hypothetical protein
VPEIQTQKTPEEIVAYENTKSSFTDYIHFDSDISAAQKRAFIGDLEYVPEYKYDKLNFLIDDDKLRQKKTAIQEAVMELEVAEGNPTNNRAELELYLQFHEQRLKKILLVEAARRLLRPYDSAAEETARETFLAMNVEVFGEIDRELYMGMLTTEAKHLDSFQPTTRLATVVKADLEKLYDRMPLDGAAEEELMSLESLSILHKKLEERYRNVLNTVPDTDDTVLYDAATSAKIINDALVASGLAKDGWEAIVHPTRSVPSTGDKLIRLPGTTRRTAEQLQRLILHEVEVHARREQNGKQTKMKLLSNGTAEYADVEEGLGVLFESALEGNFDNESYHRARDRYITAGLATGLDSGPRDARDTYEILWRIMAVRKSNQGAIYEDDILSAKDEAYKHIENAFRGTVFYEKGVIYSKLKVYYEGLMKNAKFFADAVKGGTLDEALNTAMLGKFNHTDPIETGLVLEMIDANKEKP